MENRLLLLKKYGKSALSVIIAASLVTGVSGAFPAVSADEEYDETLREELINDLSGREQRGDINGDGIINVFDLMRYKNNIVEGKEFDTDSSLYRLDANGDSTVNGEDAAAVKRDVMGESKIWTYNTIPVMDGSTSAIPLEAGLKSKMLGINYTDAKRLVQHHKTHESFSMLLSGENDMIFTVPISESQQKAADEAGVHLNFVPVAKEGFVFVVNRNNPVESLTQQQIKDIYSGKITNWKEVGGNDEEIIPYQRNNDSGSQNYMVDFMKDSVLMNPPKEYTIGSMGALMDGLAVYDNAENAIGYSVYSYAAQMYENSDSVKFIGIDGIKPTRESMADGTYPLLSSTYILYTDDAPQKTRDFAKWATSEEGQECVLACGYVPVKDMTYPDSLKPYQEKGTGKEKPADYQPSKKYSTFVRNNSRMGDEYQRQYIDFLKDKEFQDVINSDMDELYSECEEPNVSVSIINGYMSIVFTETAYTSGYYREYYTYLKALNYDLRNNRKIEKFSDLFYKDENFVQEISNEVGSVISRRFTDRLKTDYLGLIGDVENFTVDAIIMDADGPYMYEDVYVEFGSCYDNLFADKMITGEYFDNENILDDRFCSNDGYCNEWNTEEIMGDDGEIHTVVSGSRFHSDSEVAERNKVYEKVWNEAAEIRSGLDWGQTSKITIYEPSGGKNGDSLNVLYVNFGKLDGPLQTKYIFDVNTGERVYLSDILGDQNFEYTDSTSLYSLDLAAGTAEMQIDWITEVSIDVSKINMEYISPRINDLTEYTLSEPLYGYALGTPVTDYYAVYGYSSSYVLEFGAKKTQWPIEGVWNIVAKNKCYSHSRAWYECWDADNGDYYGWISYYDLEFN